MARQTHCNMSAGVELETARFLSDRAMLKEYERLRDANSLNRTALLRSRKFRRRLLQIARLSIVALIVWMGISIITEMGLWFQIYHAIVTVF